jgi:hypothetical protein
MVFNASAASRQKEHSWLVVLARLAHALLAQRLAATRRGGTPFQGLVMRSVVTVAAR